MTPQHTARWRNVLAVVGAAAVLAAGADTIAYSATGDSLLLGKSNKSSKTTTVQAAKGPALSLRTSKKSPPLAVSSGKLVKKLNADLLDGLDAQTLDAPLQRVTAVARDQEIDDGGVYRSFTLPAGTYEVVLRGAVNTVSNTDTFQCLLVDLQRYTSGDVTGMFALGFGEGSEPISHSSVFTIPGGRQLVTGCSGANGAYAVLPVELALRKVRATKTVPTQVFTPRQAARLRAGLQ